MSQDNPSFAGSHFEAKLAELLNQRFNLQELKDLCLDLNIDFENIAGSVKKEKAQELTKYFARRDVLDQLVAAITSARPDVVIDLPHDKAPTLPEQQTYAFIACVEFQPVGDPPRSLKEIAAVSSIVESQRPLASGPGLLPSEGPQYTGVRLHSLSEIELVLVSFGHSVPLFQSVLQIATEAKASGNFALRAGIHSAVMRANHDEGDMSIPTEFINLTRSTMLLGKAGHILATSHVAETVRNDQTLKRFIREATKCEVKYHVRLEIHNVYDALSGKFGNPASPNPAAPTQILKAVSFPSELRCAKSQPITLTFSPDIDYAKVVFSFRNPDLQVSGEGLGEEDYTFDCYAAEGNFTKTFDLWAVKSGEETIEPITIRCFDAANELMGPPVRGRVKLRVRAPTPSGLLDVFKIPLWAWDRFICLPRMLKVAALIVALVLGGGYAAAKYDWNRYDQDKERLLIAMHFWPQRYRGDWTETFVDTTNHRPAQTMWCAIPSEWSLVDQPGTDLSDKALSVRGESIGYNKLDNRCDVISLYDFKAKMQFNISPGQRSVSWILRAQSTRDYYLFVVNFPSRSGEKATINGFVFTDGKKQDPPLPANLGQLPYNQPIVDDVTLFLEIEVKEYSFVHRISLNVSPSLLAKLGKEALFTYSVGQHPSATFSDPKKSFRWGWIGFKAMDSQSEIKVEDVTVTHAE